MDELLNEHEQGERVRSWLQRNALSLIGGIGLGLGLVVGWNVWQDKRGAALQQQANEFDSFEQQLQSEPDAAIARFASLPKDTPYSALAGLAVAQVQVNGGKFEEALATLRSLKADDALVAAEITQRTALVLLETGKAEEAVKVLGSPAHASGLETLGDAQRLLQKPAEARAAYDKALALLDKDSFQRQIVEAKLAQLDSKPAASPAPATPPAPAAATPPAPAAAQ